ncbi:Anoctamin, putative [Bodo saltans]|uniref:Anoctamin, putative n=1 Tax=Bodo saltans TaxID=75058 RepID=A0A0S4IPU1_BODSA|nr:Anoctamin, putative [Bodo saltans]|eukprot:CUF02786.1 Anoctamin, putative [Bodo saltans]
MHNDFAMLVVLTGDKRSALAQYLVTTAETEQFGKCIVIPPPTKLTSSQRHQSNTIAEAPAVVGVPFPTLSWLEKRVDELNFAAIQRVAPELPFPNGHSELLDCERYLLMEQYFQTCIGHVASKDVITLIPLHDSQAAPKNRWTIIGNGATSNLDELRAYFGEPVAFYFAWMEHYNQWLLIPSGFGLLTLGWDWVYGTNADTNPLIPVFSIFIVIWAVLFVSVWERRQNILACRFHSFGLSANDSSAAAFIFIVIWAVLFVSVWERRQNILACRFHSFGLSANDSSAAAFTPATLADLKEAVSLRDGYRGTSRKNSFTGEYEIHYSLKKRFLWQCFSFAVTSVMLVIAPWHKPQKLFYWGV